MKKFTLLACALLAGAATGFAQEEVTLPGGLKTSTKENPIYYRVSNMRAQRFDYVTGDVYDATHTDVVMTDGAWGPGLPAYLPDGNETPMIWEFPYMGLALVDGEHICAFSPMTEVMNPQTIYWWFEKGTKGNSVYIHNAVIDGAIKNVAQKVNGRPSMGFSEKLKQAYYVIPLTDEQLADMELDQEEFVAGGNAFAFSKDATLHGDNGRQCLDMNNYITFNYTSPVQAIDEDGELKWKEVKGEDGETLLDENGDPVLEPVYDQYGFAGVNLDWDPTNHGKDGNSNYMYNNGSLFTVEEMTDKSIVEKAIAEYEQIKYGAYRETVQNHLKASKEDAISVVDGYRNLPAIYGDTEKLDAIVASIESVTIDTSEVKSLEDVETFNAQAEEAVAAQLNRALIIAGNGTVITLQNMLGLRDWQDASEVDPTDNFNVLCNAYLTADGAGMAKYDDNMLEAGYSAVYVSETVTDACKWTMEYVAGQGYRLKNGNNYIRQYGDWEPLAEWGELTDRNEEDLEEGQSVLDGVTLFTWALTENAEEAAVFTFEGCSDPSKQTKLKDSDQEILDTYYSDLGYLTPEAATSVINNAHVKAINTDGGNSWLFRDSTNADYNVISYGPEGNRWYAESGCWNIAVVTAGEEIEDGIAEIVAPAKATGCYDLQGRRVSNPSHGLYIINGVKTLVK